MYTSQGVISVHSNSNGTVRFVPNVSYSIEHENRTFAVFVPQRSSCNGAIIAECCGAKGVEVGVKAEHMCIASEAAAHHTNVQLWVKCDNNSLIALTLASITEPAK